MKVPFSVSTQLYEEILHEELKSTHLQFHRMHPTKNCTFAFLEAEMTQNHAGKSDAEYSFFAQREQHKRKKARDKGGQE